MKTFKNIVIVATLVGLIIFGLYLSFKGTNSSELSCTVENIKPVIQQNSKLLKEYGYSWNYNTMVVYKTFDKFSDSGYSFLAIPPNSKVCTAELKHEGTTISASIAIWRSGENIITKFIELN